MEETHSRYTTQSIETKNLEYAKDITVYKNGDPHFVPRRYVYNKRQCPSTPTFMDSMTRFVKLPYCCNRIYDLDGNRILHTHELAAGNRYVVAPGNQGFKHVPGGYENIQNPRRRPHRVQPLSDFLRGGVDTYAYSEEFYPPPPRNHRYRDVSGRIKHQRTQGIRVFVHQNGDPWQPKIPICFGPKDLEERSMRKCVDIVGEKMFSHHCKVNYLIRKDDEMPVTDPKELEAECDYIAVDELRNYRSMNYDIPVPLQILTSPRNDYISAHTAPSSTKDDSSRRRPPVYEINRRPRTLPAITKTGGQKYGSPDNSVASNPEYHSRHAKRPNHGVPFHAKPQRHKPSPDRQKKQHQREQQVDYDRDEGGVFKAKNSNKATHGAREVKETKNTRTDLPVDQRRAEEVTQEEMSVYEENSAPVPSGMELNRLPSDPSENQDEDIYVYQDKKKANQKDKNTKNDKIDKFDKGNDKNAKNDKIDKFDKGNDKNAKKYDANNKENLKKDNVNDQGKEKNLKTTDKNEKTKDRDVKGEDKNVKGVNKSEKSGDKNAKVTSKNDRGKERTEKEKDKDRKKGTTKDNKSPENKNSNNNQRGGSPFQDRNDVKRQSPSPVRSPEKNSTVRSSTPQNISERERTTGRDSTVEKESKTGQDSDAERDRQAKNEAAIKIQSHYKGYLERKKISEKRTQEAVQKQAKDEETAKEAFERRKVEELEKMKEQEEQQKQKQKDEAATTIQKNFKAYKVRQDMQAKKQVNDSYTNQSTGNMDEDKAATKIQAQYRGYKTRKQMDDKRKEEEQAATKIQAQYRGHKTRKEVNKQKEEKKMENSVAEGSSDKENAAATKIQAGFRGHRARKEVAKQKQEEEMAATKIQSQFRGHKTRKDIAKQKEEEKAATKIQANYRGHVTRKELQKKSNQNNVDNGYTKDEVTAATKIQASFRGHKTRKELNEKKEETLANKSEENVNTPAISNFPGEMTDFPGDNESPIEGNNNPPGSTAYLSRDTTAASQPKLNSAGTTAASQQKINSAGTTAASQQKLNSAGTTKNDPQT